MIFFIEPFAMDYCNDLCKKMHNMGIPLDKGEWLELAYYMRTISQYSTITSYQKKSIQGHLIKAFKNKKFNPEDYKSLTADIDKIRHTECDKRLEGLGKVLHEMSDVINGLSQDIGELASKQAGAIISMGETTSRIINNIKENKPAVETISLVSALKENCHCLLKNVSSMQNKLKEDATFDPLTKLYNRGAFDSRIKELAEDFIKTREPLSLIFLDIDHFKKFNDTYGHQVGDQVLAAVSGEILRNISTDDFAARYGGEEMVVLMKSDGDETMERAERLRQIIEEHKFLIRQTKKIIDITVSIGVALCRPEWSTLSARELVEKIIMEADSALYNAKNSGRNRVCIAT